MLNNNIHKILFVLVLVFLAPNNALARSVSETNVQQSSSQKTSAETKAEKYAALDQTSLKALAKQGDHQAQFEFGLRNCPDYDQCNKLMKDESVEWIKKAAETGHIGACRWLGEFYYRQGRSGRRLEFSDIEEMNRWYSIASDKGDLFSTRKLRDNLASSGMLFRYGTFYRAKMAVEQAGEVEDLLILGKILITKTNFQTYSDNPKLAEFTKKELAKKTPSMEEKLFYDYAFSNKAPREAIEIFTRAADKGSLEATKYLYNIYYNGDLVGKDYSKALPVMLNYYYRWKAIELAKKIQDIYDNGGYGVVQDPYNAYKWAVIVTKFIDKKISDKTKEIDEIPDTAWLLAGGEFKYLLSENADLEKELAKYRERMGWLSNKLTAALIKSALEEADALYK